MANQSTIISVYPNLFLNSATIRIYPAESGEATLEVCTIQGRQVKQLFNEILEVGLSKTFILNNDRLASGVYIIRLVTKTKSIIQKIILIR